MLCCLNRTHLLLAFLSKSPEVHPMLGEKVACKAVFPHMYTYSHTYKCNMLSAILAAAFLLQGMHLIQQLQR